MCTIAFIPTGELDFELAHNRDETIHRLTAAAPKWQLINDRKILAPIDRQKGGTWIWTSEKETVFLFNGAFAKHDRKASYNRSRGQIALEALDYSSFESFCQEVNLNQVEPFTIVHIPHQPNASLTQLVWDEDTKHISQLSRCKHIWSSVTLYDQTTIKQKEELFEKRIHIDMDLLEFMQSRNSEAPIFLDQHPMQTVSTTTVIYRDRSPSMDYHEYSRSMHG